MAETTAQNDDRLTYDVSLSRRRSLPIVRIVPTARNNIVILSAEFVGTFFFLLMSFAGTQIANTPAAPSPNDPPNPSALIMICLAFGLSLTANVWAFYRVSGGMFNPAVSFALFLVAGMPTMRTLFVILVQLVAGIAAAGTASALFPGPMNVATVLGGGTSICQGLFIEAFLTAQLIFVILMLAVEKQRATFMAPLGIGVSFFLSEICGVYYTGGSLNPARSLGPAVVNGSFPRYFWIYWVGPGLGSLLACGFYEALRQLNWHEANPGQDSDGRDDIIEKAVTLMLETRRTNETG